MSRRSDAEINGRLNKIETEFHGFGNAVAQDLMKLHKLLYTYLQTQGLIEHLSCANCDEEVLRPKIEGLEQSDECPSCSHDLYKGTQTSIQDWDNGEEE